MKNWFRVAPYILNVLLGVALAVLVTHRGQRMPLGVVRHPQAPSERTAPTAVRRDAAFTSSTERRRSMIDRLRALGVPNDLLARVALVDFQTQWDAKFAACHGVTSRLQATQLAMELSKDAEMKAALGEAGFRKWDQKQMLWEAMSTSVPVSPAEASAIYDLKKTLQRRQYEVEQARLAGTMDDAQINDAYDQAYAEYYSQLKGVLGEERYNKSQQLDDAFEIDNLRSQLAGVHPSDAQIQQLLDVEKAARQSRLELDHQFQNDLTSAAYQDKLSAMTEAQNEEYQRILGADAYEAYQKTQDPGYAEMKKYEGHWGLDDSKVDLVYGTMKDYAQHVNSIKADVHALQVGGQAVDWTATQQKLQQLADNVQQTLMTSLGNASFEALQRNRVLQFVRIQRAPNGGQ